MAFVAGMNKKPTFDDAAYLKLRERRLADQAEERKQAEAAKEKEAAAASQSSADSYTANYLKLRAQRLSGQIEQKQQTQDVKEAQTSAETANSGFDVDKYLKLRSDRFVGRDTQSQTQSTTIPANNSGQKSTAETQRVSLPFQQTAVDLPSGQENSAQEARRLAQAARREYETARSQAQYSGHAASVNMAAAAQPGSTYNLPRQESDELRALREKAEAAEAAADRAEQDYRLSQDRKTYEQDMQRIQALSPDAREALETYARLYQQGRNSAMQNQYLNARMALSRAGLSAEDMDALAETWTRSRNAESMEQAQADYAAMAEENPLLHNVMSVPAGIAGALTGTAAVIGEAIDRADGSRYSTLDPNLPGYTPSVYTGTVREVTAESIDDGSMLGKAGATLYSASMSAADNLARIVTLGPTGSLAFAGMASFQDSVRDVTQRGGTPAQAYAMGIATAGLEIMTEKVSIDNLISTKTPQNLTQLLKNIAIQGGIEVSEEELNFAGGLIADAVIMGGNSQYERSVADMIAGGMSAEEAKRRAFMNNLSQAANVAAQSFLSGGLMSGGQAGIQLMANGGFSAPQAAPAPAVEQNPAPAQNAAQTAQTAPARQDYGEAFTQNYLKLREERLAKQNQPSSRYVAPDGLRYEDMTPAQQMAADMIMAAESLKNRNKKGSIATPESVQADSITPKATGGTAPNTTIAETPQNVNNQNYETESAAQLYTTIDGAISKAVEAWGSGSLADPATLDPAWEAYASLSDAGKQYFLDSASGRAAAFIRAREADVSNTAFLSAYDTYREISYGPGTSADHAEQFAAALDNMVRSGHITKQQWEVLQEALSYDTPDGWTPATRPSGAVSPDESVGAAPFGFDPYTELQYRYGNQPDRANDFRPVNVPKRDTYGRNVTEFAANAYGSEYIPDSFIPELEQLVVEGALGHDTRTNEESFRAAAREIEERGEARSKNDITKAVTSGKIGENDVAKALALLKHYANKNGVRAKEAAREMCINVSQLATRSARDLQLFSTLRRKAPMGAAVEAVTTIEEFQPHSVANRFKEDKDFSQWKKDTQDAVIDMATQIDNIPEGDVDSMRTIIRELANFRRTTAWFGNTSRLTAIADAMVNKLDFQTAKEIAIAQLSRIPDDFRQRSTGEILKTIRIQNMLSSLTTVNRNLVGNSAMALVDGFSDSTVGAALDHLVSKVTNRREVSNDMTRPKAFMNAATEAAQMAALCAELDIPMDTQAKYPTGRTRTFSPNAGVVSRFFSAYEKYLKYGLEVTDSFFEGGAEATVRASLEKLGAAANLSDEDLHSIARQTAARRTFKDNRKLARASQKAKDALNEIGTDHIGLGDFVIPFANVGSNVAHTAIDYSTGGLGGLYELFTLMRDAKAGKTIEPGRQRKAVTDAARGITGLGLISVFTVLASQGVLLVSNDKDWDKRGLEQSEGLTGTQLNLSAAIRALEGKDTAYQQGDILLGVDFMEPFNAQMRIGYLLSQEDSFADMLQAYPGATVSGVAQTLLDSPLMEGLSDVVDLVDGAIESAAAQEPTALVDAAGQLLGTTASGFIPAPVRQAAQVIDPFYRDTTGGNALEKAANQAIAQIPFASMTLPKKYSGLGEEQRRYAEDDELFAFFNTFIAPGKITQASPSEISGYLNELSEATGSVEIYPDYLAPKSFTFDGKTVEVSGKEMTEAYQRTYGENISRIYSDLIATEGFAELSNDMQVTAIKKAKQYATDLARKAVSDYTKSWMEDAAGNEAASIISDVLCAETGLSETRYKAAAAAGMSMESMKSVAETMGNLSPEEGYSSVRPIQQYEAITQSPDLNDEEEEAWLKVYFSDSMDKKLDTALDMGYTAEVFVQAYRSYLDNDNRKADTVQELQEKFGLSQEAAEALYEVYKGTK